MKTRAAVKREKSVLGCKLLRADASSLREEGRVFYQSRGWQKVPGNGAYLCATNGLQAGGQGPLLAWFRGRKPTGADAPPGVQCFAEVRRVATPKRFAGWLDLRGCDLKGVKLPESVAGWLDLSGCDLKGVKLPESVGSWLDLRGCDLKGVKLPEQFAKKIIG